MELILEEARRVVDAHPDRQSILDEAKRLVYGDRNQSYGDPLDDFGRTAGAFNALTQRDLTAEEGVIFMLCVKLSRECHRHKTDNLVDLAGYSDLLQRIADQRAVTASYVPQSEGSD